MTRRVGFLGGTFDPPHRGHVELARRARSRLGLDQVLLAPAGIQPLKVGDAPGAAWQQRMCMVELATAGQAGLQPSRVDAPRESSRPNYSVETIARLREQEPDAEVYFLLGADAFAGLRRWHQPEELLKMCELVVASRPGFELPQDGNALVEWMPPGSRFLGMEERRAPGLDAARPETHESETGANHPEARANGQAKACVFLAGSALVRIYVLEDLHEDIAATELRSLLAKGEGFEWLPGGRDGAVADYIRQQRLYVE